MTLGPIVQWIVFGAFALIALAGALGMATTMSMFRSGIFLMASFMGVAGLFILLQADLLGLLQVMMYIGGMLVMILFMVLFAHDPGGAMMADMDMSPIERFFSLGLLPRKTNEEQAAHTGHEHGGHEMETGETGQMAGHQHGDHEMDTGEMAGHQRGDHDMDAGQIAGHEHHDHEMDAGEMAGHEHGSHEMETGGMAGHEHGSHEMETGEMAGHEHGDHDMAGHEHAGHGMDMSSMTMTTPIKSLAAAAGVAAAALLVAMLLLRPAWPLSAASPDPRSAEQVGSLLMGKYMMAFEGAGLLILVGIFGAVYIAHTRRAAGDTERGKNVAVDEPPSPIAEMPLEPVAGRPHVAGGESVASAFRDEGE